VAYYETPFEDFRTFPKRRIGLSFFLSILFHFTLLFFYVPVMLQEQQTVPVKPPIEIMDYKEYSKTLPDSKTKLPKVKIPESQIAESEEAQNRQLDPNAKYLGKQDQTVEKETRADRIDDFRAKQGTGSKGIPTTIEAIPPTASDFGKDESIIEEGEIPGTPPKIQQGVKRNWKTLSLKDLSVGGDGGARAATDDKLNVDRGERTLLSTREYKFFGYYQRIKDLLRQYWKPNIEHQMARLWGKGKQVKEDELVTRVLVLLDENGNLSKISKLASSGYIELDEAAVEAFQAAAPFPNPPRAMLDEDGFVRINWDFILTTDNSPRIQFRNVGSVPPPY